MPFSKDLLIGASGNQGGGAFYEYQIEQSIRMDFASNSYLRIAPGGLGTPTSLKKGTWSYWFKLHGTLGNSSTPQHVHFAAGTTGGAGGYMFFESQQNDPNNMKLNAANLHNLDAGRSDGVYRDPTAWYHMVIKFDSTQSTQSDRLIFYVNGQQVSGFSTSNVSENEDLIQWNTGGGFIIGARQPAGHAVDGTDMYFAEFIWVDGTAYAPTQFGETKNGVWIPKDPSGTTFGNNGFHLKFQDASDLGNDSSGNDNDFASNGLGTDHQVLDSPTFGE